VSNVGYICVEMNSPTFIRDLRVRDVRYPTSLQKDGSDAMHTAPDYSSVYVELFTDTDMTGYGMTFTVGRGNELVCSAVNTLAKLVVGKKLEEIFTDFGAFWRTLVSEQQLRWVGPEKGTVHLAVAAIVNAVWDLWGRMEGKPVWKLLVDMEPQQLIKCIDWRYLSDALSKEEAVEMLVEMQEGKKEREEEIVRDGFPAYTTHAGWLGYGDEDAKNLLRDYLQKGFDKFKFKVGQNLDDDKRRCKIARDTIGPGGTLMVDANQVWDVEECIEWMKELAEYKPLFIEEPTSPDDILGHKAIAEGLSGVGIGVATGEMCHNRVMFKQFIMSGALHYCQIDACRVGGVNENLATILIAKKYGVPIVPHAGGCGLCEMVQHLSYFDYISVSGKLSLCEYADHLHHHFTAPAKVHNGRYVLPHTPGIGAEMWEKSVQAYEYPGGSAWQEMFKQGLFPSQ